MGGDQKESFQSLYSKNLEEKKLKKGFIRNG